MVVADKSQASFYKEFLMARRSFVPQDYGVDIDRQDFDDKLVVEFNEAYGNVWTIDELLLHPREASRFCEDVRRKYRWFDVPDDVVLRVLLQRRKNPYTP